MTALLIFVSQKSITFSTMEFILILAAFLLAIVIMFYFYLRITRQKNQMIKLLREQNLATLKVHNELKEAKEKAEESDRLKTNFLANVSHEIRTPLNAIVGFSSLIQDESLKASDRDQFTNLIHDNSNKLLEVMDEIFDIAQIESGMVPMHFEPCLINKLLVNVATQFNIKKALIEKEDINIRVKRGNKDDSFSILTDENKLKQTLVNLIENALKYTESGSIDFGYDLLEDNKIQFFVKDSGIGFHQEKLDVLFERFRQFDEGHGRTFGGIGLGLTLSKKFVELLGGTMWADSTLGEGSTFYFILPCQPAQNQYKNI